MAQPSDTPIFSQHFGGDPDWLITAPGRVNLIGEHIDYLGGYVMPVAIDRSLKLALRKNDSNEIRVWTPLLGQQNPTVVSLNHLEPMTGEDSWLNYVLGPLEMLRREGVALHGFDAVITSDIPTGAGLSSSAALETAAAIAAECLSGQTMDPIRRAELCQQAEHEFAGVPCGIMDQFAVGLGQADRALMIDCRDFSYKTVRIPNRLALLVADTKVSHALGDGEYRKRRESCDAALSILERPSWREVTMERIDSMKPSLGSTLYRRARHAVTEMARVPEMEGALNNGGLEAIGMIMKSGHESLRDDFEVSCPELDFLVQAANEFGPDNGLIGSRMTGGGFGGSTINLVHENAAKSLQLHLEQRFQEQFARECDCFITGAAKGAHAQSLT